MVYLVKNIDSYAVTNKTLDRVFNRNGVEIAPVDPATVDRYSLLGTPVLSTIEIPSGSYKDAAGKTIQFDGIRIDTAIMSVSQSKNIVTTAINGRNGTVKEYVSDGDYYISISGLITGESSESNRKFTVQNIGGEYPENDVRKLVEICRVPESVEIISEFLDFFEIRRVVVTSFRLVQTPGLKSGQAFEMELLSDDSIELLNL